MVEIFHTNSKNGTKQNNFHLILNLGLFQIFRLNFNRNIPVLFHIFHSGFEKLLNQIVILFKLVKVLFNLDYLKIF